jgi:hypothetical protein
VALFSTFNNQSYFQVSHIEVIFSFQRKMPDDAEKVFIDPVSLVWIYFLESQMNVCPISMKKTQSDSISGSEAAGKLDILLNKMKSR